MPAIQKSWYPKTKEYLQICKDAEPHNERADCSIKALAVVTGKSYVKCKHALEANGKKSRCGCRPAVQKKALAQLGFTTKRVDPKHFLNQLPEVHKRQLKHVTNHQPDRFPYVFRDGKVYLLYNSKHVAAMVNGKVHDWTRGMRRKVVDILEVLPL